MKKKELAMWIEAANHGHRLLLIHYWVKGVYLVRIADAAGKKYPGGYVVVEDDLTNPEADRKKINWIIRLRDKVEELQASADPDDADRQGKEIDNQVGDYDYDSIKTPDLDLDDLELPTAEDLLKPLPGDPLDFDFSLNDPMPNIPAKHRKKGGPE